MEYEIQAPAISSAGVYFFTTDSGVKYEVRFGRRKDNILHATIVFGVINDEFDGEEYTLTNRGEIFRVMNTLVKIVQLFMSEHPKMTCYEFTGMEKEGELQSKITQRGNLYLRYLKKTLDNTWEISVTKGSTIIVSKNSV
jgi:hypothetical protein